MNSKVEQSSNALNTVWWIIAFLLLAAGLTANYYFAHVAVSLRVIAWLVLVGVIGVALLQTVQGQNAWHFTKEAKVELRKVVWPTRQETIQTTMIVIAVVFVLALFLWAVDSTLLYAVGWLTGQRG